MGALYSNEYNNKKAVASTETPDKGAGLARVESVFCGVYLAINHFRPNSGPRLNAKTRRAFWRTGFGRENSV
jgi:hypothetical protein